MKKAVIKNIKIIALLTILFVCCGVLGCSNGKLLTDREKQNLDEILGFCADQEQMEKLDLPSQIADKFPAVDKLLRLTADKKENYLFVVSPIGYRGAINMMVVIDAENNCVKGIKVLEQDETPEWGIWLVEEWFTDRFKGKSVERYLKRAILEAEDANEIIQITSATVSTQAVINGVNSAMGVYREIVLGEKAEPIPLKVEEYITESF